MTLSNPQQVLYTQTSDETTELSKVTLCWYSRHGLQGFQGRSAKDLTTAESRLCSGPNDIRNVFMDPRPLALKITWTDDYDRTS